MQLLEIYSSLKKLPTPFFTSNDVAALLNISLTHASKVLSRLRDAKFIIHLKHNLWTFPDIDQLALPVLLTTPLPAYISLQSALFYHGMISQIPERIHAVSIARSKTFKTSLGIVVIHHIQPDLFFGDQETSHPFIRIATPEKALVDYFYFEHKTLPEVELPDNFKIKKLQAMLEKIPSPRKRTLVERRIEQIIGLR